MKSAASLDARQAALRRKMAKAQQERRAKEKGRPVAVDRVPHLWTVNRRGETVCRNCRMRFVDAGTVKDARHCNA